MYILVSVPDYGELILNNLQGEVKEHTEEIVSVPDYGELILNHLFEKN